MKSIISENLIINGDFSNGSEGWDLGHAEIIDGQAVLTNNDEMRQSLKIPADTPFQIKFTVSAINDKALLGCMTLMARGPGSVEKDLVVKFNSAKTYVVTGSLSEHWDSQRGAILVFDAVNTNGGYKLDDVQFYLTDGIDREPGQLLENGYFSEGLEHWDHSEKVVADGDKVFLPEFSNIQQTVRKEKDKAATLKFNVVLHLAKVTLGNISFRFLKCVPISYSWSALS